MERVPPHPTPKVELEQYLTPSHIASSLVWTAFIQGNITGKRVADLGCGTGRLCAGISRLEGECVCVEVDRESLQTAVRFFRGEGLDAEFVEGDCTQFTGRFDTVIQNPPFGVKVRGVDLLFLRTALRIARVVYSIHKSNPTTRELIRGEAQRQGFSVEVLGTEFPMRPYYPWHKSSLHRFLVDLYVFKKVA